ncbi:MAG TPA: PilZ domain-containing protein [Leptospiraceae bacterium]|nr:PilZ domain-containing protein [Leptospiraceae bacterium]
MISFIGERRKRIKRPPGILFAGIMCFLYPVINIWSLCTFYHIPVRDFAQVFRFINGFQTVLVFAPALPGIGLLSVKKWGWYSFLAYCFSLLMFNIYALYKFHASRNVYSILETAAVITVSVYFLRRDISAPYMKLYPRGFRGENRIPVEAEVEILCGSEKWTRKTRDFSVSGFYTDWNDFPLHLNSEILARFRLGNESFELNAGVVRTDENGAGFAFRDTDSETESRLERSLA